MISFLIVLFLSVNSQLLKSVSNCFSSCLQCSYYSPYQCLMKQEKNTCQAGYFFNSDTSKCMLMPSLQSNINSQEFTKETTNKSEVSNSTLWKQGKVNQCTYIDQNGLQKYFGVIGLFKQIYSISKQFEVSEHHQSYLFSFNLMRSSWMPNNDFLIIDIESGSHLLSSYEISYPNRQIQNNSSLIVCNEQSVISQKFNIRINFSSFSINKIKITFTGFLFTSVWGITNIKFIPGCQKFTIYNNITSNCDFCNQGFYPVYNQINNNASLLEKCEKCNFSCIKCFNQSFCTACIKGYRLMDNKCIVNQDYSTVSLTQFVNSEYKICRLMNKSFYINSESQLIETLDYTNSKNKNFGNSTLTFEFIYNIKFLTKKSKVNISVNNNVVDYISSENFTNKGFALCSNQSNQQYSIHKFSINLINIGSKFKISLKGSECTDCKFGIYDSTLFYIESNSLSEEEMSKINLYNSLSDISKTVTNQSTISKTGDDILFSQKLNHNSSSSRPSHSNNSSKVETSSSNSSNFSNSSKNTTSKQVDHLSTHSSDSPQPSKDHNQTEVDHICFSKNGLNGIMVKLDSLDNSSDSKKFMMRVVSDKNLKLAKSTTLYQIQNAQHQHFQSKFVDSNQQNVYFFNVNQSYLNRNIEIYQVNQSNQKDVGFQKVAEFLVDRVDGLDNESQDVLNAFQHLFQAFALITIAIIFMFTFMGKIYLIEEMVSSIQFLLLGIYVFSSYLPASILNTISGLKRLENFDFFAQSHLDAIEHLLLGNMVQDSPLRFSTFHKDINFTRAFIPIFFFIVIILLWYTIIYFYQTTFNKSQPRSQNVFEENLVQSYRSNSNQSGFNFIKFFHEEVCKQIIVKKHNYFIQILKMLFLPIVFLSFKQFNNLSYPVGYSGELVNMLFCFILSIITTCLVVGLILNASRQYFKLEYIQFLEKFNSIYFKKIPKHYLPTDHHRIYFPILNQGKICLIAFLIAILGGHSIITSSILIVIYAAWIFYSWFFEIYQDSLYFKFEISEAIMFGVLSLINIILSAVSGTISTNGYLAFGFAYMSIAIVIILNSFVRSGYLIFDHAKKIKQKWMKGENYVKSERVI